MLHAILSHFLTIWFLFFLIVWSYKYFEGKYFKVIIFTCVIHYVIIITQNHFMYFGTADISDYEHYFLAFSSHSSVTDILSFVSTHVPFYTLLYPGWLYSVLGPDSFVVIRTINFALLLLIVIPLNHILSIVFDTYLQPWQLLILILLPSTTRYTVMISRDMIAAFLAVTFIAIFLKLMYERERKLIPIFLLVLAATLMIRVHNVVLVSGSLASILLLNLIYSEKRAKIIITATLVGVLGIYISYILFINYGPAYHNINSIETLASVAEGRTEGQTLYLEGHYPSTVIDLLWYLPLHGFYFLFSPMPWHVYNIESLVGFVEAWFILSLVIAAVIKGRKIYSKNRSLVLLTIIIVIFAIGFGSGVKNAGGAMRWRLPATILLFTLSTTILNIAWQRNYKHKLL